jgi:hypothetical protein
MVLAIAIDIQLIQSYSLWNAANDLVGAMRNAYNADTTRSVPTSFIVTSQTALFCPKDSQDQICKDGSTSPPDVSFGDIQSSLVQANGDLATADNGGRSIQDGVPINNLLQAMVAAIRLDLGNVRPNNFLTSTSALEAITSLNADNNGLYTALQNGGNELFKYPIYHMDETAIDVQFECRFQYPKPWSQILIAVFVATVSMLGSAWAGFMKGATYLATRRAPRGEFFSQFY